MDRKNSIAAGELCARYTRVSTPEQAEHETSLEVQGDRIESYVERADATIVASFEETGVSGRTDVRPQFQAMVDAACCDPPPFTKIVIYSLSRLFRNTYLFEFYRQKLAKFGVSFVSITEDMGDGPAAKLVTQVINGFNEFQSAEISKHVTDALHANARMGFWNGSRPPLGYRTVHAEDHPRGEQWKKRIEPCPTTRGTVELIFRLLLEGDGTSGPMGIKKITLWLNANGYVTTTKKPFHTSKIGQILTCETYAGRYFYNRTGGGRHGKGVVKPRNEWIEYKVPPLIDEETFQRAQLVLASRRPYNTPPRTVSSDVLLTGLARCECGKPLMNATGTSRTGKLHRYYKCSGIIRGSGCTSLNPARIREDYLDETTLGAVAAELLTPQRAQGIVSEIAARRLKGRAETVNSLVQLKKQQKKNNTRHRNLLDARADGTSGDNAVFRDMLREAEQMGENLVRLIAEKERSVNHALKPISLEAAAEAAKRLREELANAPVRLKKRYLRALVSHVVVTKEEIVIIGPNGALAEAISGVPTKDMALPPPVRGLDRSWLGDRDANRSRFSSLVQPKPVMVGQPALRPRSRADRRPVGAELVR